MSYLCDCPRCGERSLEKLSTHSYCLNCNYSPEEAQMRRFKESDQLIPRWAVRGVKEGIKKIKEMKDAVVSDDPPIAAAGILGLKLVPGR